jgi:spore coat protein H
MNPLFLCAALLLLAPLTWAAEPPFFGDDALHVVHVKLTRKAWDEMQPTRKGLFSGVFAATRPATQEQHESPFGYQYVYVHAAIDVDGTALTDVGVRFKGNSSYMFGRDIKKPLKLDFDRYVKGQTLFGLSGLNLHNNAFDPSLMREWLSYQLMRDAGMVTPRTAGAVVYLSVEGLHERKLAGLYVVVEEVSKPMLKASFGDSSGLLLKPENAFNLPYQGDGFERYKDLYRPKSGAGNGFEEQLIGLTRLIHKADDATFAREIESYLDVPSFLRFVAGNAMLANMDSFLSTGHNFYVYIHPQTKRAHFVPWDLNLSFGTFDWVGTLKDQADLSLLHPWVQKNRLTERVLAIAKYREAYLAEVKRMTETAFAPAAVAARACDV